MVESILYVVCPSWTMGLLVEYKAVDRLNDEEQRDFRRGHENDSN